MMPRVPLVVVPGDTPTAVMAHTPELLGVSLRRVLWRFGFQPGRALALATGVWSDSALWVMAVYSGTVLELYRDSWATQPPARFVNVMAAVLEQGAHDRRDFSGLHPRPPGVPAATPGKG